MRLTCEVSMVEPDVTAEMVEEDLMVVADLEYLVVVVGVSPVHDHVVAHLHSRVESPVSWSRPSVPVIIFQLRPVQIFNIQHQDIFSAITKKCSRLSVSPKH